MTVEVQILCPRCERSLPPDGFYPNKSRSTGRQAHCKDCSRKMAAEWNAANPERRAQTQRAWRAANPEWYRKRYAIVGERIRAQKAAARAKRVETPEQREKRLAYSRAYYRANREEELRRQRERYAATKGKTKAPPLAPAWLVPAKPAMPIAGARLHLLPEEA